MLNYSHAMEYLSKREQQIMEVLYQKGSATAEEVRETIPNPPSNSSTRTLLRILCEKGVAMYEERDGRYIYSATRPAASQARSALRRVLDVFFQGSVSGAVSALLTDADSLSPEEIKEIEALIEAAKEDQA